jgi:hypothetical protein
MIAPPAEVTDLGYNKLVSAGVSPADLSKLQLTRLPLQTETRELASYLASSRLRFTKSLTITAASGAGVESAEASVLLVA